MGVRTIQPGACETVGLAGDFHRPYETQKPFPFTIYRTTLPQSAHSGCQLPQRGSRETFPFIVPVGKSGVAGDFHRPYGAQRWVLFTIQ